MKTKITKLIVALVAIFTCATGAAAPTFACTEPNPTECSRDICSCSCVNDEIKAASGCSNASSTDLRDSIVGILNGIIAVLGLVAVIFIVMGGVTYMTSAGDANKTKKAKDTILYAVIGLIICVLAFALVNFVIINIIGNGR